MFIQNLILEGKEGKLIHLEHAEDVIINDGIDGAKHVLAIFEDLFNTLKGRASKNISLSLKFDGSPSLIWGFNPENNKFFVGTKSVFNIKNPKLLYTSADIQKYYGGKPDLAQKLSYALRYLKPITPNGVYQGDLMFTKETVRKAMVDGVESLIFRPNTITYVVPLKSDLARTISTAKIGIVIHTKYIGKTIESMKAQFLTKEEPFIKSNSVWLHSAYFNDLSGKVTLTKEETVYISNLLLTSKNIIKHINKDSFKKIIRDKNEFPVMFKIFVNQLVRSGEEIPNPYETVKKYLNFFKERKQEEIQALKNDKVKDLKKSQIKEELKLISENKETVIEVVSLYKIFSEIKSIFIKKLNNIDYLQTFIEDEQGFTVTPQEGFVAIDHVTGSAIKLVDRLTFSRLNFLKND